MTNGSIATGLWQGWPNRGGADRFFFRPDSRLCQATAGCDRSPAADLRIRA
jgi:hypothetical protein